MGAADYYPQGAYTDPSAPWNEPAPPKMREFGCDVQVTLQCSVDVPTQAYSEYIEEDEMGKRLEIDTDNVDWEEEYNNNCITIKEMLEELQKYVEHDLAMTGPNTSKGRNLKELLEACKGWEVVETYVCR